MVSGEELTKLAEHLYKSEQDSAVEKKPLPKTGALLDLWKKFECRLIERKMVVDPVELGCNPLWFLAETERNIFLWRNKSSISQVSEYNFWIDLKRLASKRLAQLENSDKENPFLNPLWPQSGSSQDNGVSEKDYIINVLSFYNAAEAHLTALSAIELLITLDDKEPVVLPITPQQH